ncbi:sigma-70 family RNA polymerase sigma factor [Xanthomonas sp. SI]|uniref:RNA polymerase sigma factor n=2 Tax=unclassified Xanthomonas TaxID=2643310 RepID=UPI00163B31F3|nr:sigma-70 family RNA polymerase sigma factor [Xanthomonas sp. SI]QNH11793.1 RNA polymerase sigma factor RpoE [Xanthomonas sp. SI]
MERDTTNRERADQLLVVRCQLGERAAFDDLIRRWSGSLHRYALKLGNDPELANDLTQDVWLRVIQGIARLREAAQFRPWLFGIAHRTFMDRLRTRYAMPVDTGIDVDEIASIDDSGADEDLERTLTTNLALLPIVEREVLTLFYLEELSLVDIADALGIPVGTVKSRLFRARTLLRKQILLEDSTHDQ